MMTDTFPQHHEVEGKIIYLGSADRFNLIYGNFYHRWIKDKNPIPQIFIFPIQNVKPISFVGKPTYFTVLMKKILNTKSNKQFVH